MSNYRGKLGPYDWDWTKLNDAFDRGIRVTDVDGFVEVNRHYLFIEGKSNSKPLPKGQKLALRRLSGSGNFTVIVIVGKPPDQIEEWYVRGEFLNELVSQSHAGDYDKFVTFVRSWFEWADKNDII